MRTQGCASPTSSQLKLISELVDYDDRPTLIFDVFDAANRDRLQLIHSNPAISAYLERVHPPESTVAGAKSNLLGWASDPLPWRDSRPRTTFKTSYQGLEWEGFVIQEELGFLRCSAAVYDDAILLAGPTLTAAETANAGVKSELVDQQSRWHPNAFRNGEYQNHDRDIMCPLLDKTGSINEQSVRPEHPQHRRLALPDYLSKHDWLSTALGPIENWSDQLFHSVLMISLKSYPRVVFWGPEFYIVYNEAGRALLGQKHPAALGGKVTETFADIWDSIAGAAMSAMYQGRISKMEEIQLMMERRGPLGPEETYWKYLMIPIYGCDGIPVGVLDEFTEMTRVVIAERRVKAIKRVAYAANVARTDDFWARAAAALEPENEDFPFALFYSVDGKKGGDTATGHQSWDTRPKHCSLKAVVGFEKDHPAVAEHFDLGEANNSYATQFTEAYRQRRPLVISVDDGTLPAPLVTAIPGRGFGDPCSSAVIIPILNLEKDDVFGFLFCGLNPHRPYDWDYETHIDMLAEALIKSAASVVLPEEQRRAQAAAEETASKHALRSKELLQRTEDAESSEARLSRIAAAAPVGICLYHPDGTPIWVNQAYMDLSGIEKNNFQPGAWAHAIHPEDRAFVEKRFAQLTTGIHVEPFEFRVKRTLNSPPRLLSPRDADGYSWNLAEAFLHLNPEGNISTIMGWLTDISHQKWSEQLHAQRLEDALETKRQSENFIDMTSHEMRNPLSAIIQSADGILTMMQQEMGGVAHGPAALILPHDTAEAIADAAQTIVLCAQHQKRIVDDILTLSKLDANLLLISPDKVDPVSLVKRALKMHEAELVSGKIQASMKINESYKDLAIDAVMLDQSRLLQVLINLLTNAIKFTQDRSRRQITISLGASATRPLSGPHGVAYIPQRTSRTDHLFTPEWGLGEEIFLQFAVQDTGPGLTPEEIQQLFQRFAQASPKTYAQYGGSGLGLFISRELTELQGGQVGVHSVAGQGSTFKFYVKARRYVPEDQRQDPISELSPEALLLRGSRANLPLRPIHPVSHHSSGVASHVTSPSGMSSPALTPPMEQSASVKTDPLHILVVEDNLINQKVVSQQLRRVGCNVHVANHGGEALAFLTKTTLFNQTTTLANGATKPADESQAKTISTTAITPVDAPPIPLSVILMDLEMPVMDGLTCVRRIREMQREGQLLGHVPVIAVTANARGEQIAAAIENGADSVVTKPFRIPELMAKMEALLKRLGQERGG